MPAAPDGYPRELREAALEYERVRAPFLALQRGNIDFQTHRTDYWKLVERLLEQKEGPSGPTIFSGIAGAECAEVGANTLTCHNPASLSWRSPRINGGPRPRGRCWRSCRARMPKDHCGCLRPASRTLLRSLSEALHVSTSVRRAF